MNVPVLALDVAAGSAAVCLITADNKVFTATGVAGKQHSQLVLPMLEDVLLQAGLTWKDLRMLAFGQGPGSFTGLRIAGAMLAGINASLKLPIWGMSSLAITATQADYHGDETLWVLEDARANEVFVGAYQQAECMHEDACKPCSAIDDMLPGLFVCQQLPPIDLPAWQRLPLQHSRADAMAIWMQQAWTSLDVSSLSRWAQPHYLQRSQAEKNLARTAK